MAISFTKPATTDNYLTEFVPNIQGNQTALAQWLDSTNTTITGTAPTYAKRYNRSTSILEEYNGTVWANLPLNISGSAGTAATATSGTTGTFYTAVHATEGRIGTRVTGYNDVYLYNNATEWGVTSVTGGVAFKYTRSTAKFVFNGNISGNATTATSASSAATASACSGNSVTATTASSAAACTGNSLTATTATNLSAGYITTGNNTISVGTAGASNVQFMGSTTTASVVTFHRAGAYAINLGLDTDNIFRLGGYSNGTNIYRWTSDTSGNFIANGNVSASSDSRLKTDLVRISGALDKVGLLTGYLYTRIDSGERHTGLIAQDVQKVLPEAVLKGSEYLAVSYGNMLGLIVEAIKELRQEVNDLKNKD